MEDDNVPGEFASLALGWMEDIQFASPDVAPETVRAVVACLEGFKSHQISLEETLDQLTQIVAPYPKIAASLRELLPAWALARIPCTDGTRAAVGAYLAADRGEAPLSGSIATTAEDAAAVAEGDAVPGNFQDLLRTELPWDALSTDNQRCLARALADVRKHLPDAALMQSILTAVRLYVQGTLSLNEVLVVVQSIFPMHVPNLSYRFKQCVLDLPNGRCSFPRQPPQRTKTDIVGSYYYLPPTIPSTRCSGRETVLPASVAAQLNDTYVSIPRGSEYDPYRRWHNPAEEAMFAVETEMFELDMQINTAHALLNALCTYRGRSALEMVLLRLTAVHLKTLADIYGPNAPGILKLLALVPSKTAEALGTCLEAKVQSWCQARDRLIATTWKETMELHCDALYDQRSSLLRVLDRTILTIPVMHAQAVALACYQKGIPLDDTSITQLSQALKLCILRSGDAARSLYRPSSPKTRSNDPESTASPSLHPATLLHVHVDPVEEGDFETTLRNRVDGPIFTLTLQGCDAEILKAAWAWILARTPTQYTLDLRMLFRSIILPHTTTMLGDEGDVLAPLDGTEPGRPSLLSLWKQVGFNAKEESPPASSLWRFGCTVLHNEAVLRGVYPNKVLFANEKLAALCRGYYTFVKRLMDGKTRISQKNASSNETPFRSFLDTVLIPFACHSRLMTASDSLDEAIHHHTAGNPFLMALDALATTVAGFARTVIQDAESIRLCYLYLAYLPSYEQRGSGPPCAVAEYQRVVADLLHQRGAAWVYRLVTQDMQCAFFLTPMITCDDPAATEQQSIAWYCPNLETRHSPSLYTPIHNRTAAAVHPTFPSFFLIGVGPPPAKEEALPSSS